MKHSPIVARAPKRGVHLQPTRSLVPVLAPDGVIPPDVDRRFRTLAVRATEHNSEARNALYAAFAPRLQHWIRRAQASCVRLELDPAIEPDDIEQEAFLVFADLLQAWDGNGSLSGYVIAYFPWRLSSAVRRMIDPRQRRSIETGSAVLLEDGSMAGDQAVALLQTIAETLPPRWGRILLMRIRDGLTWDQIATDLEVDRRTALRDWRFIIRGLRKSLGR